MVLSVIVGLLCLAATVPLAMALPQMVAQASTQSGLQPFGLGVGLGLVGTLVVYKKLPILPVLEHELTHLAAALLLFRQPLSLSAGKGRGEVVYTGRGSVIIRLAPYVVPTFTIVLLCIGPFIADHYQRSFLVLLGSTWAFHVLTALEETRPYQPDLREGGLFVSFCAVIFLDLVFYFGTALWSVGGASLVVDWLSLSLVALRELTGALSLAGA
jgi:hypothetical protein